MKLQPLADSKPYLFFCSKGGKGAVVHVPDENTSADWARNQNRFTELCGAEHVKVHQLHPDQCVHGIYYAWGLASSHGAWYDIVQFPDSDAECVREVKAQLRREQDVVTMITTSVLRLLEFNWK